MNPLRAALKVLGSSFRDLWQDLWMSLVCSILWLIANVLVVTGPPATMTLFYYSSRAAHGELTDFGDLWHRFKRSFGVGWRWGIINLLVMAALIGDIALTGQLSWSQSTIRYAQGLYVALILVWTQVQLYALAFLQVQEEPRVRTAWRNGAVLLGRNILFSIVTGIPTLLILLAGIPLFMLTAFFGPVLVAGIATHAVIDKVGIAD